MKATLNSGLNFIKHVDCGREMSKEAHKVLLKNNLKLWIFIAGFGNGNYIIWQT